MSEARIKLVFSPQPGIGRGRERDENTMRDGCGKGAGIHPQFPHTRYFLKDAFKFSFAENVE